MQLEQSRETGVSNNDSHIQQCPLVISTDGRQGSN